MSTPASPQAKNNYAAPNTPIASSKQQKKSSLSSSSKLSPNTTLSSPVNKSRQDGLAAAGRSIAEEPTLSRRPSVTDTMHSAVTPSKNLFSPNLRYKADGSPMTEDEILAEQQENNTPTKTIIPSLDNETTVEVTNTANEVTNNTESSSSKESTDVEDDEDVFNPYLFIGNLPPHATVMIPRKICLPPNLNKFKITLALDLDETLVHCSIEPVSNPDHIFPVTFNDMLYQVYVKKRPYLDHFLEVVSKSFEIVVFTASQKVYADTLLDLLDPEHKFVNHRLFREACLFVQGNYLKDLTVLGRDLSKTLLVDNSPHAYGYHIDNGIPIESWFDDSNDTELLKLIGFLKKIENNIDDVRPIVHEHFKTYQLVQQAKMGIPVSYSAPPF